MKGAILKRIVIGAILVCLNSCKATDISSISETEAQLLVKQNLCDFQISFGSYGSGTPSDVHSRIVSYIKDQKGIKKISTWSWGLEGESDYCIEFSDEKLVYAAKDDIVKMIPATSKEGYTILKFQGKEIFRTQWPKD